MAKQSTNKLPTLLSPVLSRKTSLPRSDHGEAVDKHVAEPLIMVMVGTSDLNHHHKPPVKTRA
jgi:hypothetical protein